MIKTVYLGLGSNLGPREEHLRQAIDAIRTAGVIITRESSMYETAPLYRTDQPAFLNMVVEGETSVFPRMLLGRLQGIERAMGRRRSLLEKNGPRVIDIDLLFYGRHIIQAPELVVPHPKIEERRFVLEPLAEIAPGWRHPVSRKSIQELLRAVQSQAVRRLEELPRPPASPGPSGI